MNFCSLFFLVRCYCKVNRRRTLRLRSQNNGADNEVVVAVGRVELAPTRVEMRELVGEKMRFVAILCVVLFFEILISCR